jgi:hypothetical protein
MSKHGNKHGQAAETVTEVAPAAPEVSLPPQASEPAGDAPAIAETVTEVAPEAVAAAPQLRAFEVEIPQCLLGLRTFVATNADDALRQYKALGGITSHVHPARVNELPTGSRGWQEAVAASVK